MTDRSTLSRRVEQAALGFCWDSWAQIGIAHGTNVFDDRAADPEALVVFTLEVARRDPRLFDEVLDWLRENERLVSVQRLRNLSRDERDRRVVQAVLAWLSRFRSNPRFRSARPSESTQPPENLFVDSVGGGWTTEPTFVEHGLVRGVAQPSFKSRSPDPDLPINFAFRLRLALGVGSRAEVIRYLLTAPDASASVAQITRATSFAKRNIAETLDGLAAAGVARATPVGNERRYELDRTAWTDLLRLRSGRLPRYRDWPHLLSALRQILRFLADPDLDSWSDYLRASAARDLMESIERDLASAGVQPDVVARQGERLWDSFVEITDAALEALRA